jgi:hypothetical protein
VLVLAPLGDARGNAGPTSWPADAIGEPAADLGQIAIVHETLAIDTRPVANPMARGVSIDVLYRIENRGPEVTVPTAFASPSAGAATVTLDGVPIDARPYDPLDNPAPPLPEHWGEALPAGLQAGDAIWFDLTVTPGEHELAVRYVADTGGDLSERPGTTSVDYLLAPARDWSSFGTLEIRVFVPENHRVEITPPLPAAGSGAFIGHFEGLPADVVRIRMRREVGVLTIAALFSLALVGVLALAIFGRWTARGIVGTASGRVPAFVVGAPLLAVGLAIGWFVLYESADRSLRGPYAAYESLEILALAILLAFTGASTAAIWGLRLRRRLADGD